VRSRGRRRPRAEGHKIVRMRRDKALVVLGTTLAVIYVLAGIIGGLWPSHWDDSATEDRAFWIVFLLGGGLALLIGLRSFGRSPWLGASLVSMGALAGALAIFWTIAVPIAAITLVVLSVMAARRSADPRAAAQP
jgi:di/tricarboxylate transporter